MDNSILNILWLIICSVLIFLMQAGFLCLEAGLTRTKNNINVALKNLTDFCISVILFWMFGYALIFGRSNFGFIGVTDWFKTFPENEGFTAAFFLFQAMFCATAATIFSGAVAERMRFIGYIMLTLIISGLIYPVFGHWAWNNNEGGWLKLYGFVDFAGSTVVHSVGGWFALAALLAIGPRTGRFQSDGKVKKFIGSNLPLAVLGVILLWLGWFGFNGGSLLKINFKVAQIIINTILAGSAGALILVTFSGLVYKRVEAHSLLDGSLAGLVAITAGCHAIEPGFAIIVGMVGGLIAMLTAELLEYLHIDDSVNAVPVHLGAGIWGTIAVAIFGNPEILNTGLSRSDQLAVQFLGIICCALWSFIIPYILIRVIHHYFPLRVTLEEEEIGLNISEHGANTETVDLLRTMDIQAKTGDLSQRVPVESFSEIGQIADRYNRLMETLDTTVEQTEAIVRDIKDGVITFNIDGIIKSYNKGAESIFQFQQSEILNQSINFILIPNGPNSESFTSTISKNTEFKTSSKLGFHFIGQRKDKSTFHIGLTVTKGKVQDDTIFTALIRDITESKKAEKKAAVYLRELEKERDTLMKVRQALELKVNEREQARRATFNILQDKEIIRVKSEDMEKRFRSLSMSSPIGIFVTDSKGNLLYTNPRWESITGLTYHDDIKTSWLKIIHPEDQYSTLRAWARAMKIKTEFSKELRIIKPDGGIAWIHARSSNLASESGGLEQFVNTVEDITTRKKNEKQITKSLKEKNILLQEIHHRVKNNMQIISSLINLHGSSIHDGGMKEIFKESENRVKSMALIHEKLYESDDLSNIGFAEYLVKLSESLFRSYNINSSDVKLISQVDKSLKLTVDIAVPCGLIVNELISNSLKYAFKKSGGGEIVIKLDKEENTELYRLIVSDNGCSFPTNIDYKNTETLGMQLVTTLTEQIGATIELDASFGTTFEIKFDINN